jgi:DNA polymerase-3 subunit epsilon
LIYSVVDIETSGGSHGNRITEIAIVKTDGKEILDSYETLINPEVFIPRSITHLTGISNAMVEDSPRFDEVAHELKELLDDTIFVAHNVSFDYGIIKNHFDDCEIAFNLKKLCTVRLAKGILPGHASYSLGKICNDLNIPNENRHRAMGDAQATAQLFNHMVLEDKNNFIAYSLNKLNREASLPPNLSKEEYDKLPTKTGVYYLLGEHLEVLYVGKAKNIKQRVTTHFTEKSRKKSELLRKIHHVSYTETGNELIALLLESDEIKKKFPPYNKAQKYKQNHYHLCQYEGQDGVLRVDVFLKKYANKSFMSFSSHVMAKDYLYQLVEKDGLCPKYTGLQRTKGRCYLGDECAFCKGEQTKEQYNEMVLQTIHKEEEKQSLLIVGKGRNPQEKGVVYIDNGEYRGFGFAEKEEAMSLKHLAESIKHYKYTSDAKRILSGFLNKPLPNSFQIIDLEHQSS